MAWRRVPFSLAAACDFAIAGQSTRFTLAYTAAGLSPDGSSTWYLPRMIGLRRAKELMLTNRMLSADEASRDGRHRPSGPDDDLYDAALEQAKIFAAGPTKAYGATKRLLQEMGCRARNPDGPGNAIDQRIDADSRRRGRYRRIRQQT